MEETEQQFLNSLDKKLWNAADRLRSNIDAAEYKHVVLGLIFLKYVSDAFAERRERLKADFANPDHDYYLGEDADAIITEELEIRDYYTEKNVFWVPALARWENLQNNAKVAPGTEIEIKNGKKITYKFTSIGKLIDDALEEIEKENPKLKNVLDKNYARRQIDPSILGQLIDKIAEIPFQHKTLHAKDILGHVYEYFLGQFALSEGKKGGQYYTPKAIVTLIVEMLQPWKGRVYDPAMGSGGFFVSSEKFIEQHEGKLGNISVYGQESNPTTWRLAAMNMAIRGIDFNFGGEPANTFSNDKHPDLRADFVMANPPFNMKEWNTGVKDDDPRWQYGIPPAGQRQLRLDATHALPPGAQRQHGPAARQRLHELQHQQRRRNPQTPVRRGPRRMHGRAPRPTVYQHPNPRVHLVSHQKQKRQFTSPSGRGQGEGNSETEAAKSSSSTPATSAT